MDGERRGKLASFVLLPAIIVAVGIVAYFTFRTTLALDRLRQEAVLEATLGLAREKAARLDRQIIDQDNVVMAVADPANLPELAERWLPTAQRETPSVRAILILDDQRRVLGFASRATGAFQEEEAEMPWVGVAASVPDMFRFAEMLRRRGELDGARILSPATMAAATRNWTGEKQNELYGTLFHQRGWPPAPAYLGLGFSLRGTAMCHHLFGTLTSPGTFGNYGAGSTLYWVDPERDLTFVCLTAGVMESLANIERFQRLSDMAVSAAI